MNCDETHPLLHAYADGELDLVPSLEVERHLKSCPACNAKKVWIESMRSALRRSDLAFQAPPTLPGDIRSALPQRAERPARQARPWLWQWLAFGATAFAALALLLRPAGPSEQDRVIGEAVTGHIRSLMAGHLTDIASSDQHTVKPWFNGKVDFALETKDFAAQGFPLVGGRLDYLDGQTVAALVYQRNKHFINVFIWPRNQPLAESNGTRRGYSMLSRYAHGIQFLIVSDLNSKELTEFANLLDQSGGGTGQR